MRLELRKKHAPPAATPQDIAKVAARTYPENKIQAIKQVRELTGLSLKEAKDLCDPYYPYSIRS